MFIAFCRPYILFHFFPSDILCMASNFFYEIKIADCELFTQIRNPVICNEPFSLYKYVENLPFSTTKPTVFRNAIQMEKLSHIFFWYYEKISPLCNYDKTNIRLIFLLCEHCTIKLQYTFSRITCWVYRIHDVLFSAKKVRRIYLCKLANSMYQCDGLRFQIRYFTILYRKKEKEKHGRNFLYVPEHKQKTRE